MLGKRKEGYNRHKPYSAFGNLSPLEIAEKMDMDNLAA